MKRVTGIGGIFFKGKDTSGLKTWYGKHLGIDIGDYGAVFKWKPEDGSDKLCNTAWNIFKDDTDYLKPSSSPWMINYRVENLDALLELLKEEGIQLVGEPQSFEYGKFAWIMDPEGNKIELWEPTGEEIL